MVSPARSRTPKKSPDRRRGRGLRHDVAIYSPFAASYYDRDARQGGGAELQMTILARELAAHGVRTAHIVLPVANPVELSAPAPTVITRSAYHAGGGLDRVREAGALWRALRKADAGVYVLRGSAIFVGIVAEFCRLHRRGLVFSAANDFDLLAETPSVSPRKQAIYLHGVRRADAVVVQSSKQLGMARELLGRDKRIELIPSFTEPAGPLPAGGSFERRFLWVSRVNPFKQPLEFLRLAAALPEARFTMVATEGIDTDPDLHAEIKRRAAELDNVELTGALRREEVLARAAAATAIVSTSLWEGMPNVFLEAWSRRVPVLTLAFDPDGLVASRGLGIAAGGDWDAFVAGARRLWDDPGFAAGLGGNGQAYVEERHSPGAVCARWQEVLAGAAGQPRAATASSQTRR
jgi:glycosyltransferase involved in cell wall biosynthesis